MELINNDTVPIFYKSAKEMDKPISILLEELRCELSSTRGKLSDICRLYGYKEMITHLEGGRIRMCFIAKEILVLTNI